MLFVRHSSSADTVLAAGVLANPQRRRFRYVLKQELLWDPCLDIVGCRLPNVFVNRQAVRSGEEALAVAELARDLGPDKGVLIYPEGTRYSPKKQAPSGREDSGKGLGRLGGYGRAISFTVAPAGVGALGVDRGGPSAGCGGVGALIRGVDSFHRFWSGGTHRSNGSGSPPPDSCCREIPSSQRERWLFEQWLETDRWVTQIRGDSGAQ